MTMEMAASKSPNVLSQKNYRNLFLKILNNTSPKWSDNKSESEAFAAELCEIESWWQLNR